jgi:hypothetical protein
MGVPVGPGDTGVEVNPDGVPYPSANLGYQPVRGKVPGNVIENFKFLGFPDADTTKPMKVVSLADYYDPTAKRYKLLHISVAGIWCGNCVSEMKLVVPRIDELKAKGVVFLTALSDGPSQNAAATASDLVAWTKDNHANFAQVLDPLGHNLGPFFEEAALPFNANIDARTMEILSGETAAITDVDKDVTTWLSWIAEHPVAKP